MELTRRELLKLGGGMVAAGIGLAGAPARAEAETGPGAAALKSLPTDFGDCPRDLVPFLRYVVQRRAAEGLNRLVLSEKDPAFGKAWATRKVQVGTVYGGAPEDANIAWIAAAAYRYPWSRFHQDAALRDRAFFLLDSLAQIHADGKWDDGGLDAYFGLHSFAWAVLSWVRTGAVDPARAATWKEAAAAAARDAMRHMELGPYSPSDLTGQYANPEFYYLSGLAAAGELTGEATFREEAARALRRYDQWLRDGGGLPYFLDTAPQHGYQEMIVKSVALYHDVTRDPHALEWLNRLAPYYPNGMNRTGLMSDTDQPQLKHTFYHVVNPGVPALIAAATGDGANRAAADVAARLWAESVMEQKPSFPAPGAPWYNYQAATFAAAALDRVESQPLPPPEPPPARRVFLDPAYRGVRSQWDDFTAVAAANQMSDCLAGAYLADPKERWMPLGAALDGVFFEVLQGGREFRCVDWRPITGANAVEGFASTSCLTALCAPYWGEMPSLPGDVATWTSVQHWAVWHAHLVGLGALVCHAPGGAAADMARVRCRLAPAGRTLAVEDQKEDLWRFRYGGLSVRFARLEEQGGFNFRVVEQEQLPRASSTPILARSGPWVAGDHVYAGITAAPSGADGEVFLQALPHGAAALLVEPDARKAFLWVANLDRHSQQYLLDVPAGARVRLFRRSVEMPPIPANTPAFVGLGGAENGVWILESPTPLDPPSVLSGLRPNQKR